MQLKYELLNYPNYPVILEGKNASGIQVTLQFTKLSIWRNGPYIGGHLVCIFQIELQTRLYCTINRADCESVLYKIIP